MKLYYYSSNGVIFINSTNEYIYKITDFNDDNTISENNFIEMIFLNYFKIKYNKYYTNNDDDFPLIQNTTTIISTAKDFSNEFKLSSDNYYKLKYILQLTNDSLIIINKMKFFTTNLNSFIKNNEYDSDLLYSSIKSLINGLNLIHTNNFVHGDLKSTNIVIFNNKIKIIDFGGCKTINNPIYECTCTNINRSPEDFNHELNNSLYMDNIKSELWSFGIILYELMKKKNPIYEKLREIKKNIIQNKNLSNENIEKHIYEFIINDFIKIIQNNNDTCGDDNFTQQIMNKLLTNLLVLEQDKRLSLNDFFFQLFNENIKKFEEERFIFDYLFVNDDNLTKFINFRKYYYQLIKSILESNNELNLYPMMINLLDRFIISNINNIDSCHNVSHNYDFLIKLINYDNYVDNKDKLLNYYMDNMAIITCCIYKIVKIIIVKDYEYLNKIYDKYAILFSNSYNCKNIKKFKHLVMLNIVIMLNIINYDVLRPKLIFNSTEHKQYNFICNIIENFDITQMMTHIE